MFDGGLVVLVPSSQQLLVFDRAIASLCPGPDGAAWNDLAALPPDLCDAVGTFIEPPRPSEPASAAALTPMPSPVEQPQRWIAAVDRLRLHFTVDDATLAGMLTALFPPVAAAGGEADVQIAIRGGRDAASVMVDGAILLSAESVDLAIGAIGQAIVARLHATATLLATLHASAAARGDRGYVFAAPSGSGKSTLIAYLTRSGFDYLGDDLTALSDTGCLLPWPAAMSIKPGSWNVLRALYPALDMSSAQHVRGKRVRLLQPVGPRTTPVALSALLFPRYETDADAQLLPIAPLEAFARLVNDRVWIGYPLREPAIDQLLALIGRTPCHTIVYGQLEDAAALIGALDRKP